MTRNTNKVKRGGVVKHYPCTRHKCTGKYPVTIIGYNTRYGVKEDRTVGNCRICGKKGES